MTVTIINLHHKWVCGLLRSNGESRPSGIRKRDSRGRGLSHQRTRNQRNRENPGMKAQFETDASKTIRAIPVRRLRAVLAVRLALGIALVAGVSTALAQARYSVEGANRFVNAKDWN